MERLSPEQMMKVAKLLKQIVLEIDNYQYKNWNDITREQHIIINARQRDILNRAHDLLTQSIVVMVDNSEDILKSIKSLTGKIKKTLKGIENTEKIINISTSVAALSLGIITSNAVAIEMSIADILNQIT